MTTDHKRAMRIINYVRNAGNDPASREGIEGLRDAAHEAHHALDMKMKPGTWHRENIHRRLIGVSIKTEPDDWGNYRIKTRPADLLRYEVEARAVEQLVCKALGVSANGDVDHWALFAIVEMQKSCGFALDHDRFTEIVRRRMRPSDRITKSYVERVLALGD